MNDRLTKFSIYFIVEALQKASGIFLIPIYTAYMDPEQFGILSTCLSFSAMVPFLLFLSIFEAAYFALIRKEEAVENKISTIFLFEIAVSFIIITLVSIMLFFAPPGFTMFKIKFYPYIFFTLVMSVLSVFQLTMHHVLLASERARTYAGLSFTAFILSNTLILTLLIKFKMGAMSFIFGNCAIYFLIFLLATAIYFPRERVPHIFSHLWNVLRFTTPLVPHNMAHLARTYADRILLTSFVSPASTGIFHIATSYGNILLLGIEAFRNSNNPRFFSMINKPEEQQSLTAMLALSLGFFSFMALCLGVFSQEILALLTSRSYHDAFRYVPLVLSANLFYLLYINTVIVLFNSGQTGSIAIVTSISAITSVIMGAILIFQLSITGAAISMLLSNLLIFSLVFYKCQKTNKMQWPVFRATLLALLPLLLLWLDLNSLSNKLYFVAGAGVLIALITQKHAKQVGLL